MEHFIYFLFAKRIVHFKYRQERNFFFGKNVRQERNLKVWYRTFEKPDQNRYS